MVFPKCEALINILESPWIFVNCIVFFEIFEGMQIWQVCFSPLKSKGIMTYIKLRLNSWSVGLIFCCAFQLYWCLTVHFFFEEPFLAVIIWLYMYCYFILFYMLYAFNAPFSSKYVYFWISEHLCCFHLNEIFYNDCFCFVRYIMLCCHFFCLFWLFTRHWKQPIGVYLQVPNKKMCCSVAWCYFEHHLFQVGWNQQCFCWTIKFLFMCGNGQS